LISRLGLKEELKRFGLGKILLNLGVFTNQNRLRILLGVTLLQALRQPGNLGFSRRFINKGGLT